MAAADSKKTAKPARTKKSSVKIDHTIYTAILGLALLSLTATVSYVCWYNASVYGSMFTATAP